jgi:hypothetical protein
VTDVVDHGDGSYTLLWDAPGETTTAPAASPLP